MECIIKYHKKWGLNLDNDSIYFNLKQAKNRTFKYKRQRKCQKIDSDFCTRY